VWGCDEPAKEPIWQVLCWRCDGTDVTCAQCKGMRTVPIPRCPYKSQARDALQDAFDVCRAIPMLQVGVLPAGDGWLKLPQLFMDALRLVATHKETYDEAEAERRRKKAMRGKGG